MLFCELIKDSGDTICEGHTGKEGETKVHSLLPLAASYSRPSPGTVPSGPIGPGRMREDLGNTCISSPRADPRLFDVSA